ncbi:S8 family peptidase [Phormidesmis sp. 146-35]
MAKVWFRVLLVALTCGTVVSAHTPLPKLAIAQTSKTTEFYYLYFGQKIPLTTRPDLIAVKRSDAPKAQTRGGTLPFYLELQQELEGNATRGDTPIPNGIYQPLRENYTLVDLRNRSQPARDQTKQKLQQSKTVEQVLTVLTRPGIDEAIVVPNEIIVSFDPQLSQTQIESILNQQELEMLQVLSLKRKRYLVKSRTATADGTAVLRITNQLYQVQGVRSATPNFIQASPAANLASFSTESNRSGTPDDIRAKLPALFAKLSSVSQLQWYLDSSLLTRCEQNQLDPDCVQSQAAGKNLQPKRTDVYAPEAWRLGSSGRGVVVAVMDTLIQGSHPDLRGNLYTAKAANRCSGEVHGWDFYSGTGKTSTSQDICATGDPDTSISAGELEVLRPFQQTILKTDDELIKTFTPAQLKDFRQQCRDKNISQCDAAIANLRRNSAKSLIAQSFHGTAVAGVIAARSSNGKGLTGIAPNAQILPIRVGGYSQSEKRVPVSSAAVIKGLEYAEQRNVDIINMSFGLLPSQDLAEQYRDVLKDNPSLMIVASTANDNQDTVAFPACIPGVVAVGATSLAGQRAPYSNYGWKSWQDKKAGVACGLAMKQALQGLDDDNPFLDVVAPGGDSSSPTLLGGMLTAGGTFVDGFWQGIRIPDAGWGSNLDSRGAYVWIDGTSFSSPAVAGVLALMKAEDPQRKLTRQQLIAILKKTAGYDRLTISQMDRQRFQVHKQKGDVPNGVSPEQYFFGSGLVNAEAAVREVKRQVGK